MDVIWMLESHFQGVVENRSCLDADGSSDDFVLSRRALALEIAAGWPAAAEINLRYTLSYALANEDIIKGYQVDKDQYLEISKDDWKTLRWSPSARSKSTSSSHAARSTIYIWCGLIISFPTARSVTMPMP
jgi:hypothetical protein